MAGNIDNDDYNDVLININIINNFLTKINVTNPTNIQYEHIIITIVVDVPDHNEFNNHIWFVFSPNLKNC